ncbi:DUF3188 domain-containing protein [Arthrobacter sp. FB24]|uniref:DUF3188 domain-containing protein n=1 Tax=Arthrobacter sp. (strain FB24) TaxID=290399 RepID=UPI0005BCFBB9|nr:DUF3188 domain-containing protein [Arthrobacter sp. FB24]
MLNEFWNTSTGSYKALVFGAMGLIAAGILLNIAGNLSRIDGLTAASLPVIGVGLVLHSTGVVIRGQGVRSRLQK